MEKGKSGSDIFSFTTFFLWGGGGGEYHKYFRNGEKQPF